MKRFIYLIQSVADGAYKIGISISPSKRLDQLQTGNGSKLRLISSFETDHASQVEKALHNMYKPFRREGEWFDLPLEIELGFLKECKKIEDNLKFLKEHNNHFV